MSSFKTRRLLWNFMHLTDELSSCAMQELASPLSENQETFHKRKTNLLHCGVIYKTRDSRQILIILLLVLRFPLTTLHLCFQKHITWQFELGRHVDDSFNNQSATYRSDTDYSRSVFIAVNSLFKFINSQITRNRKITSQNFLNFPKV